MIDKRYDYTINRKPVTWVELINIAGQHGKFADSAFRTASEAVRILRSEGFQVAVYKEEQNHD